MHRLAAPTKAPTRDELYGNRLHYAPRAPARSATPEETAQPRGVQRSAPPPPDLDHVPPGTWKYDANMFALRTPAEVRAERVGAAMSVDPAAH